MADLNVENFYRDIAEILNILYVSFPIRTAVYVEDVAGIDQLDEYGLHSPRHLAGYYAMLWLEEESFLRYANTIRQDGIDQAALTHKGFKKLSHIAEPIYQSPISADVIEINTRQPHQLPPSVLEDRMIVVNQLRDALRSGSSIAIGKVVQHILA
jgi:hypothetical protein